MNELLRNILGRRLLLIHGDTLHYLGMVPEGGLVTLALAHDGTMDTRHIEADNPELRETAGGMFGVKVDDRIFGE